MFTGVAIGRLACGRLRERGLDLVDHGDQVFVVAHHQHRIGKRRHWFELFRRQDRLGTQVRHAAPGRRAHVPAQVRDLVQPVEAQVGAHHQEGIRVVHCLQGPACGIATAGDHLRQCKPVRHAALAPDVGGPAGLQHRLDHFAADGRGGRQPIDQLPDQDLVGVPGGFGPAGRQRVQCLGRWLQAVVQIFEKHQMLPVVGRVRGACRGGAEMAQGDIVAVQLQGGGSRAGEHITLPVVRLGREAGIGQDGVEGRRGGRGIATIERTPGFHDRMPERIAFTVRQWFFPGTEVRQRLFAGLGPGARNGKKEDEQGARKGHGGLHGDGQSVPVHLVA